MTHYQLACDKRITVAAILMEAAMIVACILLTDAVLEKIFHIQTMLAAHISLTTSLIITLILQYLIVITEMIARYREDRRGLTLPLAWFPGGLLIRTAIMILCITSVVALKLMVYFLSVLFAFAVQILRLDRHIGTSPIVDATDRMLEPLEIAVNRLYNLLYFHKIRANTSVFTAAFNSSLSLWCINH